MKIGNIVRFNDERFFEGAVQLSWLNKHPEQARDVAESFVFHGPRYHGVSDISAEVRSDYRLKDTASFVRDLLASILKSEEGGTNPYWLVVAGYGSGKSHLALTCSSLLSEPNSDIAGRILQQLAHADESIAKKISEQLAMLTKPALIIPLDGMSGFHLGNALSQAVFKQLAALDIDAEPLRSLSPRFTVASRFVERNYQFRQDRFSELLPDKTESEICRLLMENNEAIYEAVDEIYIEANGQPVPIEGQESAQELIDTLCSVYCGDGGLFSQVIIMFDEFGRYLEHAANNPHLAGDAALQQIFQGIQDNSENVRFIGFIQYELKTYLKRFGGDGLRQLQRYITRFDAAEKWYLSTNLETIFAHMIHKDEEKLDEALLKTHAAERFLETHQTLSKCLPSFSRVPLWQDRDSFSQVIGRGCWPLHPMAVWFLTRQKDVVQSRSALTFIKDTITRVADDEFVQHDVLKQVSAAELVLSNLLSELVAAEREAGGTVAEILQVLLDKYSAHLDYSQKLVLAGVAALEKMRVGKQDQTMANKLLLEATALTEQTVIRALELLSELGALEWNRDLGQYELLTDGASRGQFQQWLRQQQLQCVNDDSRNLFMRRAASEELLGSFETEFGLANNISTQDWFFESSLAHSDNLSNNLIQAFKLWSEASLPTDAKGKVIYLYIAEDDDNEAIERNVNQVFSEQLAHYGIDKAPIWVIGLDDIDGALVQHLSKLHVLEDVLTDTDRERFRRFITDEIQRAQLGIKNTLTELIKQQMFWVSGIELVPDARLKKTGNAIFSAIYTKPLPFEFDGFASSTGAGSMDCAALMRGLITKQVDSTWVQSQAVRLRNRVNTLMAQSWGALSREGRFISPREESVKFVLSELLRLHQNDPSRTLQQSYRDLMRPPYGMNTASAGLLIATLVNLDIPPRRLERKHTLVAASEWVTDVFPKQKHQLNEVVLASTTLRFLSESSESRWEELIERWALEEDYESQLRFAAEADNLKKVDPIPERLEFIYRDRVEATTKVRNIVASMQLELRKHEKELERLTLRESVGATIRVAKRLYQLSDDMEASGLWPQALVSECNQLLSFCHPLIAEQLSDWIPRQNCQTVATVSDFRLSMESHVSALELLGYKKAAETLRKQATSSIHRVEKLQEYQLTIAQCNDYPRQPAPAASTPVRELRDQIARGDELITTLKAASGTFTEEEINAYIGAISARQQELKSAVVKKNEELGVLYQSPQSESDLALILERANYQRKIFAGTPDEPEVNDILYQLEYILNDIKSWPNDDISASRLDELLSEQSAQHFQRFTEHLEVKDMEAVWGDNLYQIVSLERIEKAKHRSIEWAQSRYLSNDKIAFLNVQQAKDLLREVEAMPAFLASEEREMLSQLFHAVSAHLEMLEECLRREEIQEWLELFAIMDAGNLEPHEILSYLSRLASPPHALDRVQAATVNEFELCLQTQLDRMSTDNILQRIHQLPRSNQQEILIVLKATLNED